MNLNETKLDQLASELKIRIHEPFAEFLHASSGEIDFSVSLLDCYRLSGHACHAITGAFLSTQAAVEKLFPSDSVCVRGDLAVDFGGQGNERAAGPRANVISYITGAWGDSGFPGLKGQFVRKGLLNFGCAELSKSEIRFRRISNGQSVTIEYDSSPVVTRLNHGLEFPESWRAEISAVLKNPTSVMSIRN
jgi:hypothetical protein